MSRVKCSWYLCQSMFSQRRWLPRSHLSPPALAPSRSGQLSASLSPASTLNPTWSLQSSSWESRHYTPAGPRCLCSGHSQTSFQSSLGIRIHVLDARPGLSGSCRTVSILSPRLALHGKAEVSRAQGNGGVGKTPGFLSGWVTLSPYPHPHLAWWIEMGSRTGKTDASFQQLSFPSVIDSGQLGQQQTGSKSR